MKCPICEVDLQMTERQGIEIDYCPKCRGVWLDRGELDKIIEKSAVSNHAPEKRMPEVPRMNNQQEYYDHHDDHDFSYGHKKKHKRDGFLGDLFDF